MGFSICFRVCTSPISCLCYTVEHNERVFKTKPRFFKHIYFLTRQERSNTYVKKPAKLPSSAQIINFLEKLEGQPASKREIAHHFRVKGAEARIALRNLLKEMTADRLLVGMKAKSYALPKDAQKNAPLTLKLKAVELSDDGEMILEPTDKNLIGTYPLIIADHKIGATIGDTFTATVEEFAPGEFVAHKKTDSKKMDVEPLLGLYKEDKRGAFFQPLDKELQSVSFIIQTPIRSELLQKVKDGALVKGIPLERGQNRATPIELVEYMQASLHGYEETLAIKNFDIPHTFPQSVLDFTAKLKDLKVADVGLGKREDLRSTPLVTIDGEDSKDFDDAVFAQDWTEGDKAMGHHIIVAIADVAYYVETHSELDKEAFIRGNSVYFPKSVIPMLPERISNDLCSLNPHVERPALACHMYIDFNGRLKKHHFTRAFIKSAARLTYNNVQKAIEGDVDDVCLPVLDSTIKPLYAAYKVLLKARQKRGALDLEFPEKYILFDEDGFVKNIVNRERLDSHKLIEEMMVLANVAAASTLQTKSAPCLYRIHPEPGSTKLDGLQAALKPFNLKLEVAGGITPKKIQSLLNKIEKSEDKESMHYAVLKSLEQARYDPENVGHFGLALERYAHFTSPIRRYSDLIVHRSLIKTLKLEGHEKEQLPKKLEGTGEHLCITERRAQKAEWEVKDRFTTEFYEKSVGETFTAKAVTLTSFGIFVSIDGGMAEGLLPLRVMYDDHYIFDEKSGTLTGRRTGKTIRAGDKIDVKLTEANIGTGRLTFDLPQGESNSSRRKPKHFNKKKTSAQKEKRSFKKKRS